MLHVIWAYYLTCAIRHLYSPFFNASLRHTVCISSIYMLYHSNNFNVCNTLDNPQPIQQNGAAVSNNGCLTQLQITNQYVLPVILSILLLLCPTVCCTRIQSVCPIDSISIQFVANRLLPANCC